MTDTASQASLPSTRLTETIFEWFLRMIALYHFGLLDAQREFLSGGGQHPISPAAERSFLAVLHAMGGGLVGVGASSLCLVHFGIRRGQRWAVVAAVMAIGCAEGANTLGLASLGSPLALVTASYLLLLTIATALALAPSFAFADRR